MRTLLGGILLAVGVLIACASGLCSLAILFGDGFGPNAMGMLPLVLLFGGVPFLVGVLMVLGGLALIRTAGSE